MKLIPELHIIAKAKNYRIRRTKALFLTTALLFSLLSGNISQINPIQKTYAQVSSVSPSSCQKLPIASVTATGNDRNVRINVLDNNIFNKWSNLGVGSFIQADLGAPKTICSVDITWYRGNLRQNNFVISISNDGNSFTNVFTGKSSGTTLSAEKYNLPTSVTARFVRVTVYGNTENNWASITKLSVEGFGNSNTIHTNVGTYVRITLTGTDPIPWDVLKFSVVGLPQHGTLTNPTSNSVDYTPNPGFSGTDSFTYKATDGQGVSSKIAKVSITVNAPSPPDAYTKTIPTNSGPFPSVNGASSPPINQVVHSVNGVPVEITLTSTNPVPGDVLKFSVVGLPKHGILTDGTVSSSKFYTPNNGFSGTDSFTYKATGGHG
ncbi:MAG TPA: Ig-like domain-containing protein, partial [Candidatus Bathyarchaeia archaeon]|nr:Ig-like domain-containing protein [Candidatus Bathyarchaeia archaeon]